MQAVVKCSCPGHYDEILKKTCKKHRSLVKSCMPNGLGEIEIVGYLGAWLEKGTSHTSRSEHVAHANNPKPKEALDFLKKHGLA